MAFAAEALAPTPPPRPLPMPPITPPTTPLESLSGENRCSRRFIQRTLLCLRRKLRGSGKFDDGAADVVGLRDLLDKGLRGSGDERELDVAPIFADRVIDHGPALEERLGLRILRRWKDDPVSGLPDWDFADVADKDIARAFAAGGDGHLTDIFVAGAAKQGHVTRHFAVHIRFEDAHGGCGSEVEGVEFAGVGDQGYLRGFKFVALLVLTGDLFDGEQTSGGRRRWLRGLRRARRVER